MLIIVLLNIKSCESRKYCPSRGLQTKFLYFFKRVLDDLGLSYSITKLSNLFASL